MAARGVTRRLRGGFDACQWASQCKSSTPRRAFSASAVQRKDVVQFNFTDNAELNDLLANFRRKVLIPISLNQAQQRMIFREENRNILENDPIIIQLGREKVKLEHINQFTGMPDTRETLFTAMDLARSNEDWENVLTLLEGLQGHRSIRDTWLRRLIRRAAERDMTHHIFGGFRRGAETGLRFRRGGLVSDTFRLAIHYKGVTHGWDAPATAKALSYAEQMLAMMERDPHRSAPPETRDPWTIAAALEPAAVRAFLHHDRQDPDGKVQLYARRLVARLAELRRDAAARRQPVFYALPAPAPAERPNRARERLRDFLELRVLPLYHGLALAQTVLGSQLPQKKVADGFVKELGATVTKAMEQFQQTFDSADEARRHRLSQSWELVKSHR